MDKKKLIAGAFILIALVQLYVPAKMILNRDDIIATGKEYRFRAAPVDPGDPFRGKYITLQYRENTLKVENTGSWKGLETVYVLLTEDGEGFAKIKSVSKVRPDEGTDFVKSKLHYINPNDKILTIMYPFDRFYMEESKAPKAEKKYMESVRDTAKVTYALVKIKDGEAVLTDVLIDGVSIKEIAKSEINQSTPRSQPRPTPK